MPDAQRPGLRLGARTEFLVIGDVIPGHEDPLREMLKDVLDTPGAAEPLQHPALKPLLQLAAD